jgi:hypothetical protein
MCCYNPSVSVNKLITDAHIPAECNAYVFLDETDGDSNTMICILWVGRADEDDICKWKEWAKERE